MTVAEFVHLRVHSAFSLSEGAIHIKDLAQLCREHHMPAVAVADTGNLFGALEFSQTLAEAGVQPIIGCALAVDWLSAAAAGNAAQFAPPSGANDDVSRLVFLVQDEIGYQNLIKLSSLAYLETDAGLTPCVGVETLRQHAQGLLCLSGGADGPVGLLLRHGQVEEAGALLRQLREIFPDRLYVELQRHGLVEESACEDRLLDLAYRLNIPLVATNQVYFAKRDMYEAHDVLLCIAQRSTVGQRDRRRLTTEHYFKSAAEMRALFEDLPEAIDNTLVVARRCAYRAPTREPILPGYDDGTGRDEKDVMREQALAGLEERLKVDVWSGEMSPAEREAAAQPHRERLDFELSTIIDMGFAGYFLIVAEFIQWAKQNAIPVGPGRGSGAGSVAAWALGITDLDPLRFGLLFERFLNPERVSIPDFDIDFCQDKRDRVIRHVQDKYGHDQVAQIITFGKLQARAALRDVGRVLELPFGLVDRICKMVPNNPANPVTLAQAVSGEPRLREAIRDEPGVDRLFDIAKRLEGLYRHASTHAAGVVIADRSLDKLVPLYRDPGSDMPVTQFNMKWVEQAGLVKFDFLGLKTLTVLDRCIELLRMRDIELDINHIPLNDEPTFEMLRGGETVGVFQFESSGMRDLMREAVPHNIEDLIALVALYRPGPMENIPKYIACKHGREKPEFLHQTIEPVVADTYGVIIYQEQVMQIAQVFAGYTLGQADLLRRAMGKKIKAEMEAQRDDFVNGAMARGVESARASYVFDLVDKFAGYGFNKAHSACYAYVAYQTAYLKANYPVEFMAASMSLDISNTDKLNIFKQELDRMGIALLPPDINRSEVEFSVERTEADGEGAVRYALSAVKNVGREAMAGVLKARRDGGDFKDIWDFAGRVEPRQLNKRQLENLARAGAFDRFQDNRARLYGAAELLMRYANHASQERESSQVSLFESGDGAAQVPPPQLPDRVLWSQTEKLGHEFEAMGFYLSAHPLDAYQNLTGKGGLVSYAELLPRVKAGGSHFRIAGTVLSKREGKNKRGNPYAFVQLSDPSGMYEVTVFAEELSAKRELLVAGRSLVMAVDVTSNGDDPRLVARNIVDVEEASQRAGGGNLRVYVNDAAALSSLRGMLRAEQGGRSKVSLFLTLVEEQSEVEIKLPQGYAISSADRGAIKAIPGILDVQEI
jgi:DNA polymerase-3 subunit alpha